MIQAAPAWPLTAVREHLTRSIDVVVHVARRHDGARRVVEVGEVVVDRDRLGLRPIADVDRRRRPAHEAASMNGPNISVLVRSWARSARRCSGASALSCSWSPRGCGRAAAPSRRPPRAAAVTAVRPGWRARLRRAEPPGELDVAAWCERVGGAMRGGRSLTAAVIEADDACSTARRRSPTSCTPCGAGVPIGDAFRAVTADPSTPGRSGGAGARDVRRPRRAERRTDGGDRGRPRRPRRRAGRARTARVPRRGCRPA